MPTRSESHNRQALQLAWLTSIELGMLVENDASEEEFRPQFLCSWLSVFVSLSRVRLGISHRRRGMQMPSWLGGQGLRGDREIPKHHPSHQNSAGVKSPA